MGALLALAARMRHQHFHAPPDTLQSRLSSSPTSHAVRLDADGSYVAESPSTIAVYRHQATISTVRSSIFRFQSNEANSSGDITEILASSLLLLTFGFPEQVYLNWSLHVGGLIAMIESAGDGVVDSGRLTRSVKKLVAYSDVSAVSIGRAQASKHVWLTWNICPPSTVERPSESLDKPFSDFVISIGYPESLITIFALLSVVVEGIFESNGIDIAFRSYLENAFNQVSSGDLPPVSLQPEIRVVDTARGANAVGASWTSAMEHIIAHWVPPSISTDIPPEHSFALTLAWELARKASFIYLWRRGFSGSILRVLPPQQAKSASALTRDIMLGVHSLMNLAEEQDVKIANAMIWPLTVAGNECSTDPAAQVQILSLIKRLRSYFFIAHLEHLAHLLQELWLRAAKSGPLLEREFDVSPSSLCLNAIAREKNFCIPLV